MQTSVSSFVAVGLLTLAVVAATSGLGQAGAAEAVAAAAQERPIVAGLFAEPAKYVGRRIEIYGLVISADPARRTFQLQDVSQRPLTVDASRLPRIVAGDQVEVLGEVQSAAGGGLVLVGRRVKHVKVTGGGGCC